LSVPGKKTLQVGHCCKRLDRVGGRFSDIAQYRSVDVVHRVTRLMIAGVVLGICKTCTSGENMCETTLHFWRGVVVAVPPKRARCWTVLSAPAPVLIMLTGMPFVANG